ncbi:MAG: 5-formyltetrahydrofolate cyclo-ligase [Desulfobacteraceae bacterium]|nr:5-formyltetrahydrofolate cyclo-ligase [Desulfobacteraceae bacterium]
MEEVREKKLKLRREAEARIAAFDGSELKSKKAAIKKQLAEFANFKEAETVFLYEAPGNKSAAQNIITLCIETGKQVAVPLFARQKTEKTQLFKIGNTGQDLRPGPEGTLEPDPEKCKLIPFEDIDIAIIPGLAFDEKGGRLGSGAGRYDNIMPMLPNTARKVALAFEEQIFSAIPMETHDKYVDIIITEKRIIYKI